MQWEQTPVQDKRAMELQTAFAFPRVSPEIGSVSNHLHSLSVPRRQRSLRSVKTELVHEDTTLKYTVAWLHGQQNLQNQKGLETKWMFISGAKVDELLYSHTEMSVQRLF